MFVQGVEAFYKNSDVLSQECLIFTFNTKLFALIPKSKIKLIKSLEYRKFRSLHKLFVAEGNRMVADLLTSSIEADTLYATSRFLHENSHILPASHQVIECTQEEIKSATLLRSPQEAILVGRIPTYNLQTVDPLNNLILCLDCVQDPGNLGTLVRIADWFGITDVVCSPDTADVFSPKAVQSTMGSIGRVKVHYSDLPAWLDSYNGERATVMGAFLDGTSIYDCHIPPTGILIMGNEGNGISELVAQRVGLRLTIPSDHAAGKGPESLNVAIATAIICGEYFRQKNF